MNTIDAIIIYLACGAPFGVYYYLQAKTKNLATFLNASAIVLLWIPYALLLLHRKVTNKLTNNDLTNKSILRSDGEKKFQDAQKRLERFLPSEDSSMSLFEFREMIERYVGLTLSSNESLEFPESELELFQINGHKNNKLGAICLNRRNRLRLTSHQNDAREEFLLSLSQMLRNASDQKKLSDLALEFVKLLNDEEAVVLVTALTKEFSQENTAENVNVPEKEIWNLEKQPLMKEHGSQNLKALTATATSRKKG